MGETPPASHIPPGYPPGAPGLALKTGDNEEAALPVIVQIFFRNVVFRELPCPDLARIRIGSVLYSRNDSRFVGVALLEQLLGAFRIGVRLVANQLGVT